jgi:hypothetical protein
MEIPEMQAKNMLEKSSIEKLSCGVFSTNHSRGSIHKKYTHSP